MCWHVYMRLLLENHNLENHKLLSESQYGYRKKRSTEQATIVLCDEIRKKVQEGKLFGAVFLDLSRAFDTINHATLVEKLTLYGLRGKELDWFKSYLFNRKQLVEIDGVRSNEGTLLLRQRRKYHQQEY